MTGWPCFISTCFLLFGSVIFKHTETPRTSIKMGIPRWHITDWIFLSVKDPAFGWSVNQLWRLVSNTQQTFCNTLNYGGGWREANDTNFTAFLYRRWNSIGWFHTVVESWLSRFPPRQPVDWFERVWITVAHPWKVLFQRRFLRGWLRRIAPVNLPASEVFHRS